MKKLYLIMTLGLIISLSLIISFFPRRTKSDKEVQIKSESTKLREKSSIIETKMNDQVESIELSTPRENISSFKRIDKNVRIEAESTSQEVQIVKDKEKSRQVRRRALIEIEIMKDKKAVKPLIEVLEDINEDPYIREKVAQTLGMLGDERALNPLLNTLNEENYKIKHSACEALGRLGREEAIDPLLEILNDKEEIMKARIGARNGLCLLKSNEVRDNFVFILQNDEDPEMRHQAAVGLAHFGQNAVPFLIDALNDEDDSVAGNAALALGSIKDPSAIEPLLNIADNSVEMTFVRKCAEEALAKILGTNPAEQIAKIIKEEKDPRKRELLKHMYESDYNRPFPE